MSTLHEAARLVAADPAAFTRLLLELLTVRVGA